VGSLTSITREGCAMMGTKTRAFAPRCNRSIESLVPADNLYRHLEMELDLGFVRDLVRSTYTSPTPISTVVPKTMSSDVERLSTR
jgi:hypothetical protein